MEPAIVWRFKGSLNEVSAVEGDSPSSDLRKSSPEVANLGAGQQIWLVMGTRTGGQPLMQGLAGFTSQKSGFSKEEPWHVAKVVVSKEGSPPKSQHVPENGNQVPLRARNQHEASSWCVWRQCQSSQGFLSIWSGLWEPQLLWAGRSELLNTNSLVLYHGPCCDPHLLFCRRRGIAGGQVLGACRYVPHRRRLRRKIKSPMAGRMQRM